jgi:hypothetical protein
MTFRSFAAIVLLGVAVAACQPSRPPDPALQTASIANLQDRVRAACVRTQGNMQNVASTSVASKCQCYARRTMRALTKDEIANYRDTGVFNASARDKGLAAIDACGLKRPI